MPDSVDRWGPGFRLFALSFLALFLELMMIRWVPSVVHKVAYYANLMLISSFLGLGIGAMIANYRHRLLGWFPLVLALNIGYLMLCQSGVMPGSSTDARFYSGGNLFLSYLMLIGVFGFNTLIFVPLGQQIGLLFNEQACLRAYMWDLGGSLCGTLAFGLFSFAYFSPAIGMVFVAVAFLAFAPGRQRFWNIPVLLVLCASMFLTSANTTVFWSPYYYVTIHDIRGKDVIVSKPVDELRTMRNPPVYVVKVNQDFYQMHGTIDIARYDPGDVWFSYVEDLRAQYLLPYALKPAPEHVLVLGSGGGMDVEAALLSGAQHVDAVDIDPVIVGLARRFNASGVYDDPRVHVHVNDARAFLQQSKPGYDLVVFGFLDSQALSSQMSNLRLDSYTYTVESIRQAYSLLKPDGMLSLSFSAGQPWLGPKLREMVFEATGQKPAIYAKSAQIIYCVTPGTMPELPDFFGPFQHIRFTTTTVPPTDDWPYLYLSHKTVPGDYLVVIGILLVLSIVVVLMIRGRAFGRSDSHFFFLGFGFLLLETKSIGDCCLYFGTTWFVTMLVVAGVLIMVLAANAMALQIKQFSPWLYLPLFLSLLVLFVVPRELVLGLPLAARLAWTLLVVPLPLFFAGLIFSTTLKQDVRFSGVTSATLFGANLIGATVGGFCEYLGMAIGSHYLMLLVFAAYGVSLICRRLPDGPQSTSPLTSAGQ